MNYVTGLRKFALKKFAFPLLRIAIGLYIFGIFLGDIRDTFGHSVGYAPGAVLPASIIFAILACFVYGMFVSILERRTVTELSLSGIVRELGGGVFVGTFLCASTIAILWLAGSYVVSGVDDWRNCIPIFSNMFFAAVIEEILFRAILFRTVEETFGTWIGILVSSMLFGAVHLSNPNSSAIAAIAIAIEAGTLLSAAYVLTRRLWFVIGIHFAWNFAEGGIFDVPISGMHLRGWLVAKLSGPDWLSGGAFGPEASIVAILVCALAAALFIYRGINAGNFVALKTSLAPLHV